MSKTIYDVLHEVQQNLHAPKNQHNKFGGYNYRSCEDIFEGLKEVLPDGAVVTVCDDLVAVGDRFYVKATASLSFGGQTISNAAFAREPLEKKGMDASQITGATSSYARKYALNGLFMIDDVKDADAQQPAGQAPEFEFTREHKLLQRDFLYGLGSQNTVAEVRSYVEAWADTLKTAPQQVTGLINDAVDMRIKGLEAGTVFQPPVFGFLDIQEAVDFGKFILAEIDRINDANDLAALIYEVDYKLKAMDKRLSAAKYQTDEGSPAQRVMNKYNAKLAQLKG